MQNEEKLQSPIFEKMGWGPWGPDFRGQKRPFSILLEFESKDFAENLSKDSSTKDLSNRVGHPYLKHVLAP